MSAITLKNVCKSYGALEVMHDIAMEIARGELMVFVGPSGCGKSTLLRMIAGLEDITDGTIEIEGKVVNEVRASRRGVAMVFQSYALYPHMTVADNMAFSLKIAGVPKKEREERIRKAADMLQLTDYLKRRPRQLSGGQRQRVAIGRAITRDADIFLFDEPLSNLDAALRVSTRAEIAKLKVALPETTMVYVTHDQIEAMTLADRITVLNKGRVEQIGTPEELYEQPRNLFVASFIGSPKMNFLKGEFLEDGRAVLGDGLEVVTGQARLPAGTGTIGVRPEDMRLATGEEAHQISGEIDLVEYIGETTLLHVRRPDGDIIIAKAPNHRRYSVGDVAALTFSPEAMHLFDADGLAVPRQRRLESSSAIG
ncbi:ABC transporter ATP-binding protein [Martelella endophytica]|uniref:ABC transporter ATP-binding protein n=1 Tax=Martelella endophytica TaxID=1486262 RepID=UPI0005F20095|nr:sn-glycerol-3-phosphate ABC transporter ATP-binding protein UgpC [Martelella endophytica]